VIYPCKICDSDSFHIASRLVKNANSYFRLASYYRCTNCRFAFGDFFDNIQSLVIEDFYKYPDYLKYDHWARFEHDGIGPGRREILLRSLQIAEENLRKKPQRVLIYGNGMSKIISLLNSGGNSFQVFATFSYTGHPNEITQREFPKYYQTFDCIIAAEVFEHFVNPINDFANMLKFLKPKGWIVGTTGSLEQYSKIHLENPLHYLFGNPSNGHVAFYSRESIGVLATKLGLIDNTDLASQFGHDSRKWRIILGLRS